jgi:hypothetical protein
MLRNPSPTLISYLSDPSRLFFFTLHENQPPPERLPVRSKSFRSRWRLYFSFYTRRIHLVVASGRSKIESATLTPGFFISHQENPSRGGFRSPENRIRDLHTCSSRLYSPKIRSSEHPNCRKIENGAPSSVPAPTGLSTQVTARIFHS